MDEVHNFLNPWLFLVLKSENFITWRAKYVVIDA